MIANRLFIKFVLRRFNFAFCLLFISLNHSVHADLPASAYIQHISIDYSNSDILYAATIGAGLFISTNGAAQWKEISPTAVCDAYHVIRIDPKNPKRIFAGGHKSGVWISSDRGASWKLVGLEGLTIADLAIDPTNTNRIFVLVPDGVYRNTDIENTPWEHVFDYTRFVQNISVELGLDKLWRYSRFQKIAINPHNPSTIFIGARWEGGYHFSTDGGQTWKHEWISGIFRRVDPILFHPSDAEVIYVGTHHQGMFKSYNSGRSWVAMSRGLEPQIRTPFYGAYLVCGLARDPSNLAVFYTGSDYSNWKTIDGGRTWKELGETLTCEFARTFAVDPLRSNIVYAGTNVGVYKSRDAGESWQSANRGFPEFEIKQSLDVTIAGEQFRYALINGSPPVYRKSITQNSDWISMSWLVHEEGDSLKYNKITGELILFGRSRTYSSKNYGLRWDVPMISYAPVHNLVVAAPLTGQEQSTENWTLEVNIHGDVFFEDEAVIAFYKRPPYVSLQLVSTDYPCDGSIPFWTTNWDSYLKGILQMPRDKIPSNRNYMLYVEVRDFQKNVQIGYSEINLFKDQSVTVSVSPNSGLPCLGPKDPK